MKNLVKFFIIMTVFCITACTHILEDISNKEQIKAQGRLVMKVGNESRTIMPSIGPDDIKTAVLTANGNEIKSWSGDNIISQIQNTDDILLDVGNYEFTMTFRNANGTDILTATTNQEIVPGDNTLHFDMKLITTGNGTGDISITLTWDVASGINKITAGLYYIATNEPLVGFGDSELEITISDDETQTPTATYSPSGVPVGQYIIKFKVYNNPNIQDEKLLNTFPYVIKVAPGTTTSTQITLSKINTQYTITYNLSGGKWADGFTATEDRNANAKIILPTAENITKDGYEFGGWYDDDNNRITEIPSDTAQDVSVTAKWLQLYTITYNLNGGKNNTNNPTSYTVETETITLDIPTKNSSTFLGWYNENGEHITEITKGSTGNITVTASWRTTCTQSDVCEVIASLSGPHDILVTGPMHSNFIAEKIKPALNGNQNIKVNLDLSQTTGMNEITRYAFEGMSGLSSVILPDTVTSIGDTAFQSCSNLKSINIPNGVTSIDKNTFNGCSSLTEIDIPDSVTTIDSSAFSGCNAVKTLVTGNGLTSLDYLPITSALESVTIGDSITEIGAEKFKDFTALTSVTIGSGVTTIDYSAFSGCTILQTVTIGSGVTSIDYSAFNSCSALKSVIFAEGSRLTAIGGSAFYSTGLTDITIPASVTTIGYDAFSACSALTSVTFAEYSQLTAIDETAFHSTGLTEITIPASVTTIGKSAFYGCSALTSVTFAEDSQLTAIGETAFHSTGLTEITIPDSVTTIGSSALRGCSGLTSLTIGNGVKTIDVDTFTDCNAVKTLVTGNGLTTFDNLPITSALESITIGDSITEIGADTFTDCNAVKTLVIGNNLTSFDNLPITSALESITIGNGITEIGDNKFYEFTNLKSVTFADNSQLTKIGENAFCGCSQLTEITIPDGVTTIGSYAFRHCSSLESVTIGNSVTSIGSYAFWYCEKLTSVTIPDSVISIANKAFNECSSLTTVNYRGTEEEWGKITISGENDILTKATIIYNYQEE